MCSVDYCHTISNERDSALPFEMHGFKLVLHEYSRTSIIIRKEGVLCYYTQISIFQ